MAPPQVVEYLLNERREYLTELESQHRKVINVFVDTSLGPDQYEIRYR
jgi:Ribonuclease G/E